ncbi:helix-turn-helix domain-containing protein [Chitinophaga sp. OAE865]|uniref:AraC family transcriptional regulator n=1 Tax=Chitinophaga sp. OAE865 TaxID=2817898 RepID=UPI001AE2F806
MGLIASLPEIEKKRNSVFVMHEKSEKLIPLHRHNKGQLSYVEGGIAYITIENLTYVVPARHYFWIPRGMWHTLRLGHKATVLRSLYFYAHDDATDPFYSQLGIYPASELLIQMINYTECWDGRHVGDKDYNFEFLVALKKMLPEKSRKALPIVLPATNNEQMQDITDYLERNIGKRLTLGSVSKQFNIGERSLSRLFQSNLKISFLQYLKTIRMIRAIEMILKTGKPISEIAFAVGYSSINSFSDTFHEFVHARPTDFRKP